MEPGSQASDYALFNLVSLYLQAGFASRSRRRPTPCAKRPRVTNCASSRTARPSCSIPCRMAASTRFRATSKGWPERQRGQHAHYFGVTMLNLAVNLRSLTTSRSCAFIRQRGNRGPRGDLVSDRAVRSFDGKGDCAHALGSDSTRGRKCSLPRRERSARRRPTSELIWRTASSIRTIARQCSTRCEDIRGTECRLARRPALDARGLGSMDGGGVLNKHGCVSESRPRSQDGL